MSTRHYHKRGWRYDTAAVLVLRAIAPPAEPPAPLGALLIPWVGLREFPSNSGDTTRGKYCRVPGRRAYGKKAVQVMRKRQRATHWGNNQHLPISKPHHP